MLGAIVGDIVGSRFEWHNIKTKEFTFFHPKCFATDDSIMTLAVAKAIFACSDDYSDLGDQAIKCMQELGHCILTLGMADVLRSGSKIHSRNLITASATGQL